MEQCPCGSDQHYDHCCGLYINEHAVAKTPEALMRSRYTAYSLAHIAYIQKTMRGKPLMDFEADEAKKWASTVIWLGLTIIQASEVVAKARDVEQGFVEFKAIYLQKNRLYTIHEYSEFQRLQNRWYYIDGELIHTIPKILSRHSACPCGSQKTFKNCHALS
jgi:SEC-C motif-containing protein